MNSLYSRPLGSVKTPTLTFLCPLAQHPDTHSLVTRPHPPLPPASDSPSVGISLRESQQPQAVPLLNGSS